MKTILKDVVNGVGIPTFPVNGVCRANWRMVLLDFGHDGALLYKNVTIQSDLNWHTMLSQKSISVNRFVLCTTIEYCEKVRRTPVLKSTVPHAALRRLYPSTALYLATPEIEVFRNPHNRNIGGPSIIRREAPLSRTSTVLRYIKKHCTIFRSTYFVTIAVIVQIDLHIYPCL